MRRFAATALAALALPGAAAAGGFAYGVAAGEITPSGAVFWTRAPAAGKLRLEVSKSRSFGGMPLVRDLVASPGHDLTAHARVSALEPGTRYFYRFRQGALTSEVGRFETATPPETGTTVRFAISGDADATPAKGAKKPFFNEYEVYARMAAEGNDFNINLGDTIYSDSEVAGAPPALKLAAKWAMYKQGLALSALRKLRAATGLYSHWDDHEFVNDFTLAEHGRAVYEAGVKAFMDYAPVSYSKREGLYRTFRWGKHVELFFLDERSFRSAKASAGGVCGTPADLAPTAPAAVRGAFPASRLARDPVAQACLDRIRDPADDARQAPVRGLHGGDQGLGATFKVVVNEVPLQFYALPYDRWRVHDRARALELLRDVKNVVVLTTDTHTNLIGSQADALGRPLPSAPASGRSSPDRGDEHLLGEVDEALGSTRVGDAITALFLKPAPPRGVGLACTATDVYSYSEVKVTATTLTVTPKDANGDRLKEKTGAACGPLVVRAK